ncbi:unnamed protein product [Sphacelaria rigidula]
MDTDILTSIFVFQLYTKADDLNACFILPGSEEEEEMEEMLQDGPAGKEWGGPTRGGVLGEPTRFGDWERKGRCSDF